MAENKNEPFSKILDHLLDEDKPFPPKYLHRFSDLYGQDLSLLKKNWTRISKKRREILLEDLEELAESDPLLCFDEIATNALEDEVPAVKERAISLLWESEDPKLASRFIRLLETDDSEHVRAAAAAALGQFVFLGELDQINPETQKRVEECLLTQFAVNGTKLIRRKSLESLGYSGREEVLILIQNALMTNEKDWMSSALCAMGRSADIRWEEDILKMLNHPHIEVQEEAIRAAGGLELESAREPLLELLENKDSLEMGVTAAIIWSLSQIGGDQVRQVLEKLADEAEDDIELEYIETALENLELFGSFDSMDILNIDKPTYFDPDEDKPLKDENL